MTEPAAPARLPFQRSLSMLAAPQDQDLSSLYSTRQPAVPRRSWPFQLGKSWPCRRGWLVSMTAPGSGHDILGPGFSQRDLTTARRGRRKGELRQTKPHQQPTAFYHGWSTSHHDPPIPIHQPLRSFMRSSWACHARDQPLASSTRGTHKLQYVCWPSPASPHLLNTSKQRALLSCVLRTSKWLAWLGAVQS